MSVNRHNTSGHGVAVLFGILILLLSALAPSAAYAASSDPNNTANRDNGGLVVSDGRRFFFYSHRLDSVLTATVSGGASSVRTVTKPARASESRGVSCMGMDDDYLYLAYACVDGSKSSQVLHRVSLTDSSDSAAQTRIVSTEELAEEMHLGDARPTIRSITPFATQLHLGVDVTNPSGDKDFRFVTISRYGDIRDRDYVAIDAREPQCCCNESGIWAYFVDGSAKVYRKHLFATAHDKYQRLYTAPNGSEITRLKYADDTLYYCQSGGAESGEQLKSMTCSGKHEKELLHIGASEELVSFVPADNYVVASVWSKDEGTYLVRVSEDGEKKTISLAGSGVEDKKLNLYDLGHDRVLLMSTYDDPGGRAGDLVFSFDLESGAAVRLVDE